MTRIPITQEAVDASCDNAIENGYPINTWTAFEVADDLTEYDCDFEGYSREAVLPFVEDWLQRHPPQVDMHEAAERTRELGCDW